MALQYVQENDFCNIYGWMLELKSHTGYRLDMDSIIVYAQIYGFTKSKGMFFDRIDWLAEWLNTNPTEIDAIIAELMTSGLIERVIVKTKYGKNCVFVARLRDEDINNG